MENEKKTGLSRNINNGELQEHMKDTYGIEFFVNELLPKDLESQGYRKMSLDQIQYVEPLLQLAPQVIVDKINKGVAEKAFKAATENSYKCLLDPSMHLATIKGTTDVFIGSGLDNATNKVKGQARWLKNDTVLSISNAPQVVLNAFNALSTVTGQYFMAQVNTNLLDIKDGVDDIKKYIDAVKQSELETALQDLYEIFEHKQYIMNDLERVRTTIIQIDDIRTVARRGINLYKKQIEKIMREASNSDKERVINNNIKELQKNMIQYQFAVKVCNISQILKIYLINISDPEELSLYRNEMSDIVNQYKGMFDKATIWAKHYIDETNLLNKTSKTQKLFVRGIRVGVFISGKSGVYKLTEPLVNNLFDINRKKNKGAYILSNNEYQAQMNEMELVDYSISAMDRYIEMTGKKAEIVSFEGEYFYKYIEEE